MKINILVLITIFTLTLSYSAYSKQTSESRVDGLEVTSWKVTGSWGAVAVVHHLQIVNSSDKTFKDLKVRICYESDSRPGNIVTTEIGVLDLTILPNSNNVYLKGGATLGAGSPIARAVHFEILNANEVKGN
ncbi:MAG: hypothetical protein ACRENO_04940 [Thermodesulfobacteriota bacterium]